MYNPYYLNAISNVLTQQTTNYKRVYLVRFDLHFPNSWSDKDHGAISRFIEAFKARLVVWDKQRKSPTGIGFSYVWVREQHESHNWHYHLVFMFNKDSIAHLGKFDLNHSNLCSKIATSWASALGLDEREAVNLVHFCQNGQYYLDANSPDIPNQFNAVMQRLSYLAKTHSKDIGDGHRHLGRSQKPFL
ncbi:inovirus Gp2 family protein [Shewanella sp. GXUN23E]|uniref:inovirus Gp2 family protein n=1 Tax=Shewanella sp. GXUN23E TaxID=3422498 RepID=UPI003D7EDADA